jgi:hypothetical protein
MELIVEFWLRAELRRVLRGTYKRHEEEIALPHPRNITRDTLAIVASERALWLAAPKLDGRRALLVRARVFGDEFVVDLDRKLTPTVLSMRRANFASCSGSSNGPDEIRVVVDAEACGGTYHAHDVFVLGGVQTHTLRFSTRLDLVDEAITELDVTGVVRKSFVPLGTLTERDVQSEDASVPSDGLIIAHSAASATFGSDPWVLKWKPQHKCTIDLLVERKKCGVHFSRRVAARTSNGRRALAEFDAAAFAGPLPCVFEFAMVSGRWTPLHRREDKATANTEFVVEQTVVAINEAISLAEIVGPSAL